MFHKFLLCSVDPEVCEKDNSFTGENAVRRGIAIHLKERSFRGRKIFVRKEALNKFISKTIL